MTTQGIITNDIDNLTKQFKECEQNLKVLTEQKEKLEKVIYKNNVTILF